MLLNKKETKQFILRKIEALRPHWPVTQVKKSVFDIYDARLRNMIEADITRHPSRGKTFGDIGFGLPPKKRNGIECQKGK